MASGVIKMRNELLAAVIAVVLLGCASVQSVARDALEDAGIMCCDLSTGQCEYYDSFPACACNEEADGSDSDGSGNDS